MCLYIPFQIKNREESFRLLAVWYYSPAYKGRRIFWLPNKDRIEIQVKQNSISMVWYSGINPWENININPDLFSLVIYNLRKYINKLPMRGG